MKIRDALSRGSAILKAKNIDTAALDASLLLAEVLAMSRAALIAAAHDEITAEQYAGFHTLIERRKNGECTAYILGKKEFYGLDFTVNHNVLVPRPDTEILVETALQKLEMDTLRVLDLCTGSGAIAIALKHERPALEVWAADISAKALEVAQTNAARLLPENSPVHFCLGNLFEALSDKTALQSTAPDFQLTLNSSFHLIVSNPPYIPTNEIGSLAPEVRREPCIALDGGSDGLDIIRIIVRDAPEHLHSGGTLLIEADPRQMKEIKRMLEQSGFDGVQTYKDLSGQERVIGATLLQSRSSGQSF